MPEPEPSSGALLSIRGLDISVDGTHLVEDFDLDIGRAERVALVGESGSGKSVTARAIMRLDPQFTVAGSIRFDGTELLTMPDRELIRVRGRRIGMVFQDPMTALNPLMTVGAQVSEPLRVAGVPKRQALERSRTVLDELGVPRAGDRLGAYPHEFSGGMRQRVVLAMALISAPDLLIADEPTTALDVRVQEQVLVLLNRVARDRGLATLLITHDLGTVAGFADRVAVMYSGRKVHEDGVFAAFREPGHPYTEGLLRAVPRMDHPAGRLPAIPGATPHAADRPSGCAFHPRCPEAMARCAGERPRLTLLPSGGQAACHLNDPADGRERPPAPRRAAAPAAPKGTPR